MCLSTQPFHGEVIHTEALPASVGIANILIWTDGQRCRTQALPHLRLGFTGMPRTGNIVT